MRKDKKMNKKLIFRILCACLLIILMGLVISSCVPSSDYENTNPEIASEINYFYQDKNNYVIKMVDGSTVCYLAGKKYSSEAISISCINK
jgi:hypothetical protein